jgi:hypothetical protein
VSLLRIYDFSKRRRWTDARRIDGAVGGGGDARPRVREAISRITLEIAA